MEEETEATAADRWFGVNLKMAREEAGLSQEALANEMRERGFRYHQQTVGRIESGTQAARVGEASALAAIFGTSVETLTDMPQTAQERFRLRSAARAVQRARADAQRCAQSYQEAIQYLEALLARARADGNAHTLATEIEKAERALEEE